MRQAGITCILILVSGSNYNCRPFSVGIRDTIFNIFVACSSAQTEIDDLCACIGSVADAVAYG